MNNNKKENTARRHGRDETSDTDDPDRRLPSRPEVPIPRTFTPPVTEATLPPTLAVANASESSTQPSSRLPSRAVSPTPRNPLRRSRSSTAAESQSRIYTREGSVLPGTTARFPPQRGLLQLQLNGRPASATPTGSVARSLAEENVRRQRAGLPPRTVPISHQRARNWMFTYFGNERPRLTDPEGNPLPHITYMCSQRERCPNTGALHWQGYIEADDALHGSRLLNILQRFPGIHLDVRTGTQSQAIFYTMKEVTAEREE